MTIKYTRTLDFILASAGFAQRGQHERAAKAMTIAVQRPDITSVLASLDALQAKSLQVEQANAAKAQSGKTRSSSLAVALQVAAAKKAKKKLVLKKKKAKANTEDDFESVVNDMVEESEGIDDNTDVDLDLEDLEDSLDDGVEEMPVANSDDVDLDGEALTEDELLDTELSEADDEDEDEDEEESDDEDEEDSDEDFAEPKAEAKVKPKAMVRVNANLAALARLSSPRNRK